MLPSLFYKTSFQCSSEEQRGHLHCLLRKSQVTSGLLCGNLLTPFDTLVEGVNSSATVFLKTTVKESVGIRGSKIKSDGTHW